MQAQNCGRRKICPRQSQILNDKPQPGTRRAQPNRFKENYPNGWKNDQRLKAIELMY
jgi:hypothetical protein